MSFELGFGIDFWASLLTLTALELVLGIDNLIFIALVVGRMPVAMQRKARFIGLSLALVMRVGFLLGVTWLASLGATLFSLGEHEVSARDLVLLLGGLFLLVKGTLEIGSSIRQIAEHTSEPESRGQAQRRYVLGIFQIVILDLVFSFDSVITAVGMTNQVLVMIIAIGIAILFMMFLSGPMASFVNRNPTVKMLALAFILLVGVALVADGMHFHIPREYLYFAIAFSAGVEGLNILARRRQAKRDAVEVPRQDQ